MLEEFKAVVIALAQAVIDHPERPLTAAEKQFPLGGLGCGEGAILFEFHFWCFLSYPARASRIAVALRAHQTQELGGVNLANIAEMLGYSDDPVPML